MDHKTRLEKDRQVHPAIKKILEYDVMITKKFVGFLLNFSIIRIFKTHCYLLDYSCNGIVWFAGWIGLMWILDNRNLYEMQINMILGLLLDVLFIAIIKAATRRRRPTIIDDIYTIGPDKFSFPSGHASRSFLVLCFFTFLYPLHFIFWQPVCTWAILIAISRLLMYRHHILDVIFGILLGIVESLILSVLWLGPDTTNWIMKTISEDHVPGGPESA